MELLEKRVKSRFSQKQLFFFQIENISSLLTILKNYLLIKENKESKNNYYLEWNKEIHVLK